NIIHLHSFPTRRSSDLVFELTRHPDFDKLNFLPEDVIKECGGKVLLNSEKYCKLLIRVYIQGIFTCCNENDGEGHVEVDRFEITDRKSTRLNSSHVSIS